MNPVFVWTALLAQVLAFGLVSSVLSAVISSSPTGRRQVSIGPNPVVSSAPSKRNTMSGPLWPYTNFPPVVSKRSNIISGPFNPIQVVSKRRNSISMIPSTVTIMSKRKTMLNYLPNGGNIMSKRVTPMQQPQERHAIDSGDLIQLMYRDLEEDGATNRKGGKQVAAMHPTSDYLRKRRYFVDNGGQTMYSVYTDQLY